MQFLFIIMGVLKAIFVILFYQMKTDVTRVNRFSIC